ncbi:MAG: hypothetical protein U0174_17940 [Polyangiaceae bacterium]
MKFGRTLCIGAAVVWSVLGAGCASDETTGGSDDNVNSDIPQYVLLAFDGSYNNAFWEESVNFAKTVKHTDGSHIKFTYFVNPSYYLANAKKTAYKGPKTAAGSSAIGFGGTDAEIATRVTLTQTAFNDGHEIASHAVGHFDGSKWTTDDWNIEFKAFDRFFFYKNGVETEPRPEFDGIKAAKVVGFRAPQLGQGPGLYPTLKNFGFSYDTSKVASTGYWPVKTNGVWNFPLASLVLKNSGKRTLSMDYNHYIAHSKGVSDSANSEKYRADVVATYKAYFDKNYAGSRAPVHIGHHFSKWNGAAYWNAMKDFAAYACTKANVKCVTYREFAEFMEALPATRRAELQAGNGRDSGEVCTAAECGDLDGEAAHKDEGSFD